MKRFLEEYGIAIMIVVCVMFGVVMATFASGQYQKVGKTVANTTERKDVKENAKDADGNEIYKIKYVMGKVGQNSGDGENYTVKNTNPSAYKATDAEITLVAPTVTSDSGKVYYKFDGWYTSTQYTQKISKINPATDRGNTLYAKWLNQYTLKYDANGGTGSSSKTLYYEEETQAISNPFTYNKNGYDISFVGWNTQKDGTGTAYSVGDTVKNLTRKANANAYLYAQWNIEEHHYTLNYVLGKSNATNPSSNPSYYTVSDIKTGGMKLYDASCNGYDFKGWSTRSDGSSIISEIAKYDESKASQNYTLYAVWSPKKYTIKYIGDTNANNPKEYTIETSTISLKIPTQNNYQCLGWYSDRVKVTKVTEIKQGSTGNITLYAKWASKYTIKYNANKGTGSMGDVACVFDTDVTIAQNAFTAPAIQGYKNIKFKNWNTAADGSGKSYEAGKTVQNLASTTGSIVTLYAQWEMTPITYSINFVTKEKDTNGNVEYVTKKTIQDVNYDDYVNLNWSNGTISGWSKTPAGTIDYKYGGSYKNLTSTDGGTVTLYAVN